jgi:hypothetical protein
VVSPIAHRSSNASVTVITSTSCDQIGMAEGGIGVTGVFVDAAVPARV